MFIVKTRSTRSRWPYNRRIFDGDQPVAISLRGCPYPPIGVGITINQTASASTLESELAIITRKHKTDSHPERCNVVVILGGKVSLSQSRQETKLERKRRGTSPQLLPIETLNN